MEDIRLPRHVIDRLEHRWEAVEKPVKKVGNARKR